MSLNSSIEPGQQNWISTYFNAYIMPPVAAASAIIPVFYGFIAKSALQNGEPFPKMCYSQSLKIATRAAPTIGAIVGIQMIAQTTLEKCLIKKENNQDNLLPMFLSSMIVGAISAPALAIFNGQTMGRTLKQSIKGLSSKQVTAIVGRESSFLLSLRISHPLSQWMKRVTGDNQATLYTSAFMSGLIGSVIGHPLDTALTVWQKEKKIEKISHLRRGMLVKGIAVGGFSIGYTAITKAFEKF